MLLAERNFFTKNLFLPLTTWCLDGKPLGETSLVELPQLAGAALDNILAALRDMVQRSGDDASAEAEYARCFGLGEIDVGVLDVKFGNLVADRGLMPVGLHRRRSGAAAAGGSA